MEENTIRAQKEPKRRKLFFVLTDKLVTVLFRRERCHVAKKFKACVPYRRPTTKLGTSAGMKIYEMLKVCKYAIDTF